jgi:hypothetical protein
MAFDFYSAYVMSAEDFKPQIVLGVHVNAAQVTPDDSHDVVWFLLTSGQHRARYLDGPVEDLSEGALSVDTESGSFQFEPLTLERWQEIGEQGWIVGFEDLKDKFNSDAEIQQFYLHEFLDEVYLNWVDRQGYEPNH